MSTRIKLIGIGVLLMFAIVAVAADGISPGGHGQNLGGGFNFGNGISATGKPPTPLAPCGVGALDLSTGCAQALAYGGLF